MKREDSIIYSNKLCENDVHDYIISEVYTGGTIYRCTKCGKIKHTSTLYPDQKEEMDMAKDKTLSTFLERMDVSKWNIKKETIKKFVEDVFAYYGEEYLKNIINNDELFYDVCKFNKKYSKILDTDVKYINVDVLLSTKETIEDLEYVLLDPNQTAMLYSNTLELTNSKDEMIQFEKDVVYVGRDRICDLLFGDEIMVARRHAMFIYENNSWFLCDNFSTNGTWLNGVRIKAGKKYQLAMNDRIKFANSDEFIFDKHDYNHTDENEIKALSMLESAIKVFVKSNYEDIDALKVIMLALLRTPLYCLSDSMHIKDKESKILTISSKKGLEFVPMFTIIDNVKNITPNVSIDSFYLQYDISKLSQMDMPIVVNPFCEDKFYLTKSFITKIYSQFVQKRNVATCYDIEPIYTGKIIDNKYKVIELIGQGGFFTTYLVFSIRMNRLFAMKVCDKKSISYRPMVKEMFLNETYAMKKLDHPAIPKVVDIIEDEQYFYIVRDYIEGENLESIVRNSGAQPVEKVLEWSKQMCHVLSYLHLQNPPLIYRDMKPLNIILKSDGTIAFVDFGIMRSYQKEKSCDTCQLGTRGYAAPEQYAGHQSDQRTDIYGLGMTMFRLVTGVDPNEPPYEIKPICSINSMLPKELEYIVSKCIEQDPNKRYQSCKELMKDLENSNKNK